MTKKIDFFNLKKEDLDDFNNICDDCNKEDSSVSKNLIMTGFKTCNSCRVSKSIFPV
tara:strand:+ start:290 stop:460 length:171 start_codon:yes stop_codon:yes gene_type:complete